MSWLRIFRGGREVVSVPAATARREPRISVRRFEGAKLDRTTLDWRYDHNSIDTDLMQDLRRLRARWRSLEQNNDYAKAWLRALRREGIGPNGIRLTSLVTEADGVTLNDDANARLCGGWEEWGDAGVCTADGRQCFLEFAWTWVTSVGRDGEALIRLLPGFPNEFGFAVQGLEADYLDENYNKDLPDGGRIRMGVEVDVWGRPVAYHLFNRHPGEYGWSPGVARVRVPASEILHGFVTERFGQTRGLPWGHSAMRRLHMLGKYEEYALIAARVGAAKSGFYKQTDPKAGDYNLQPVDGDGEAQTAAGDLIREASPGHFEVLPPGWDFEAFNPDYPRGETVNFVKLMLRGFCSGVGAAYEGIANDRENVNYSSIRAGTLTERDEWRIVHVFASRHLYAPINAALLPQALLRGKIALPFADIDQYRRRRIWRGRGWAWIDPAKEIDAFTRAVALRVNSRTRIAAQEGIDIEDIIREVAAEIALAKKHGVPLPDPQPAGSMTKPPSDAASPANGGDGSDDPSADETDD